MYMFELMGDVCPCGGDCSRYWHAEGRMWGAELTAEDWDVELPDGVVLSSWGESGCTQGLALEIEQADWFIVLGTSLSEGEVREILQRLRETTREEMLRWTVEFRSQGAVGPFGLNC
jgi:hypothetical protein